MLVQENNSSKTLLPSLISDQRHSQQQDSLINILHSPAGVIAEERFLDSLKSPRQQNEGTPSLGKQPKTYIENVERLFQGSGGLGAKLNFQAIQDTITRNGSERESYNDVGYYSEATGSFHTASDGHHLDATSTSPRGKSKDRKSHHQEVQSPYSSNRRKSSTDKITKQSSNPKLGTKVGAKLEAMTKKYANNLQQDYLKASKKA